MNKIYPHQSIHQSPGIVCGIIPRPIYKLEADNKDKVKHIMNTPFSENNEKKHDILTVRIQENLVTAMTHYINSKVFPPDKKLSYLEYLQMIGITFLDDEGKSLKVSSDNNLIRSFELKIKRIKIDVRFKIPLQGFIAELHTCLYDLSLIAPDENMRCKKGFKKAEAEAVLITTLQHLGYEHENSKLTLNFLQDYILTKQGKKEFLDIGIDLSELGVDPIDISNYSYSSYYQDLYKKPIIKAMQDIKVLLEQEGIDLCIQNHINELSKIEYQKILSAFFIYLGYEVLPL